MKKVLAFLILAVSINACEKSLERRFDMSAIPGQYKGYIEVYAPDSSDVAVGWSFVRRIPENYNANFIYSIQEVNKNQYTMTFGNTDTILPNKITFEITRYEEQSYNEVDAYIKLVENDLWQLSPIFNFGMGNAINNQFRYEDYEPNRQMTFWLILKSKTWDDITIFCVGNRDYI